MITSNSLDLICLSHSRRLPDFPSWTPDFQHFAQDIGLSSMVDASGRANIYSASFSENAYVLDDDLAMQPWSTLSVEALLLGSVQIVSEPEGDFDSFSSIEHKWSTALKTVGTDDAFLATADLAALDVVSRLVQLYSAYHRDPDQAAFWASHPEKLQELRTLTGTAYNQDETGKDMHDMYFSTLICERKDVTSRCELNEMERLMTRACIPDKQGGDALRTLCESLEAGFRKRRLIFMKDKVLRIGAATEDACVGNLVCILLGCSVPVILRRLSELDEFTIVGECYMYGYMDGEAVDSKNEGKTEVRKLMLR